MVCCMARPWKHPVTGVYWFRKVVPAALGDIIGKRELKWSLGTKDPAEARRRYPAAAEQADTMLANAKRGIKPGGVSLTAEQIEGLGGEWLKRKLAKVTDLGTPLQWE